jgi:hypothetical protein
LCAWVDDVAGQKVTAKGQICSPGVVTAYAEGLFIKSTDTLTSRDGN